METYSSILAWRISWTVEPGGLQSMGWQWDMTEYESVCVCEIERERDRETDRETMEVIRVVRFVLEELPFFCKETASVMSLKILFSFFLLQISFIFNRKNLEMT